MSEKIRITYNGETFEADKGVRAGVFIKEKDAQAGDALAAGFNGAVIGLNAPLEDDGELRAYTFADAEGRDTYWHSTSHVMAAAVKKLFPGVKVAIGPAVEEGFYYDFDREKPFTEDDLAGIEAEMKNIIKENHPFKRKEMGLEDAKKFFAGAGEIYKTEILEGIDAEKVSIYETGEFADLCRGPHLTYTKKIKSFKLLKLAGAYWRGDEKNRMLQRIYGISFPSQDMLQEYLDRIEEAKQRDHRKLGRELDLFSTHEEFGAGLIYWHPKGGVVRKEMEDFWRDEHIKNGYGLVFSPHIAKIDLWETSGHTGFYRENMFDTMNIDEMQYQLKPMNCPFHILMYKNSKKSYRDLPLRWAELGTVYRYEKSGVLHGLLRVRGFTQDDAHIFCTEAQVEEEIINALNFVMHILRTFGFKDFEVYLSTMPEEHIGEKEAWEKAQAALNAALAKAGLKYDVDEGGGAFYGPKIDIKIKDALGRTWQCSTIQVDFALSERFGIDYTGKDGNEHRAIMIHRALMGSLERFFGVLIEHYKGAFPLWLAPVQVSVLTITQRSDEYAAKLLERLKVEGIRAVLDDDNEKIGAKIRKAAMEKIPYMLIIGDKETEDKTVSVRLRGGQEAKGVDFEGFIKRLKEEIKNKDIEIREI
ncbi:MAG TPA: threonine--tRNA ligase [bacterium]|nr:threonine--tRNA ligase [bacterium]